MTLARMPLNFAAVLVALLGALLGAALGATAQTPQGRVLGVVTAVSAEAKEVSIRADSGQVYRATATGDTQVLRAEPGEADISKAAKITLAEIAAGDRLLARGQVSETEHTVQARLLVVMSKESIASKNAKEQAEWRARSIAGPVKSVDAAKQEITIAARAASGPAASGPKAWVIALQTGASVRRYADTSAKFADARPSSIAEIQAGDYLRVLGNRDEATSRIAAEAVVFGSFRTLAGEITSIKAEAREVTITDLQTKKPVVVRVTKDTTVRRMPEFAAAGPPGAPAGGFPGGSAGGRTPGPPPGAGAPAGPRPGAPAGGGAPDIQRMVERMPAVPLSELKAGDAVIVSVAKSTDGKATDGKADDKQVTAITLVAGMDFLLRASSQQVRQVVANWSLDVGVP